MSSKSRKQATIGEMYRWPGKKDSNASCISLLNQDEQSHNKNLKETFKEIFGTSSNEDLNEQTNQIGEGFSFNDEIEDRSNISNQGKETIQVKRLVY